LKDDGTQLLVKALKTKFKYHVSKLNLERHYKELKLKKKKKKKAKDEDNKD